MSPFRARVTRMPRYKNKPSLLRMMRWWRICLDEVHKLGNTMVEKVKMAEYAWGMHDFFSTFKIISDQLLIARALHAQHKWCVTGTPMSRSVADIYTLLSFLIPELRECFRGFEIATLANTAEDQAPALVQLLHVLMLRREHRDVTAELHLPPQTAHRQVLLLQQLERYYYDLVKEKSQENFAQVQQRLAGQTDTPLQQLSRQDFNAIVQPVVDLRRACSHPGIAQVC